jgi:hypothetical protein
MPTESRRLAVPKSVRLIEGTEAAAMIDITQEKSVHQLIQMALELNLEAWAKNVKVEKRLKNGRIADIYFEHNDSAYIIEVKSEYKSSLIHEAAIKYMFACDFLMIAVPPGQIPPAHKRRTVDWGSPIDDRVGMLEVGPFGIECVKTPAPIRGPNASPTLR